MRKLILLLGLLPMAALAQYENSSFTNTGRGAATTFATDYQTLGINPANLGWESKFSTKRFAMGFSEAAYSVYSEALTKTELRKNIKDLINGHSENFTREEKLKAGNDFAQSGFAINLDFGSFGFAYMTPKFGGIGFRINDKIQWYSKLGNQASDLLFLGKTSSYFDTLQILNDFGDTAYIQNNAAALDTLDPNQILNGIKGIPQMISKIMDGTDITMTWTREWNVSYGRKLFGDSTFAMYAGIGFKYIQGIGMMNIRAENGTLETFSSLSPFFDISYDNSAAQSTNQIMGSRFPPKTVGKGYGLDFGLNVVIKNKLKLGVALVNVGSVKWTGNVYTVQDTLLAQTNAEGLNSYNIYSELGDILGKQGFFKLQGEKERVVKLPSLFRAGGSIKLGKRVELGVDVLMPVNEEAGSLQKGIIGIGGDVMPFKWLRLSAGFVTGGNYTAITKGNDYQIPCGFTIITRKGTYEMGLASRDAITFFTQNGPTLSLSTGFMRFRF